MITVSDQYERALRLAAVGHRAQVRRGSGVPYVAHPVAVARIVEQAGYHEAVVIAALLHDLVEDTSIKLDEIGRDFGPEVAAIVAGCSEIKFDLAGHRRPWEDRKHDHLAALAGASEATRAVALADKLHNLQSIRLDLGAGLAIWGSFHAPRDRVLWYFGAALDACDGTTPSLQALAAAGRAELARVIALATENPGFSAG